MCLIIFAWKKHEDYKLILTANRDEFYARPSERIHYWKENEQVLAGKDLQGGGTWMGVTQSGRFAALTNYRDPQNIKDNAPTRGDLVKDFLIDDISPLDYLEKIGSNAKEYNGFNLLISDGSDMYWFSNYSEEYKKLKPGVYGLSNSLLNTSWPKVDEGRNRLKSGISGQITKENLFAHLFDPMVYSDDVIPKTGVPIEWERAVSAMHINKDDDYGTVSSTVLLWNNKEEITYSERRHEPKKKNLDEVTKSFKVEKATHVFS